LDTVGDITILLRQWGEGDKRALNELMPYVYPRLRTIAAGFYRGESRDPTLGATALVHEAYMRLLQQRRLDLTDREHFYSFAVQIMRFILVDYARARKSGKRGGDVQHIPLHEELQWVSLDGDDILELVQALDELTVLDPRKVQLIELRYFLGCTAEEAAEIQQVSKTTVDRDLHVARVWLFKRLKGSSSPSAPQV
jgi:RNA polymerase sigma factor (TIGR02999 family)